MTHSSLLGRWFKRGSSQPRHPKRATGQTSTLSVERLEDRTLFDLTIGPYSTSTPALTLAQQLLLGGGNTVTGINITSAQYIGTDGQAGTYAGFDLQQGENRLAISDGVILTSGSAQGALGPNDETGESTEIGSAGDSDLNTLIGASTQDANALIITFTTDASTHSILFDFVFGSEEFPEFVGSFNDAFGAYLDGQQVSFDTQANPITVNNNFFSLNNSGISADQDPDVAGKTGVTFNIQYDGLTPTIRTRAPIDSNLSSHTLKFVIADAIDDSTDSGVFIARLQGSTQVLSAPTTDLPQPGVFTLDQDSYTVDEDSGFVTATILRQLGSSGLVTVDILTNDATATAGKDYTPFPLTTLTFLDGQASQTITVPITDDADAEGPETFYLQLANPTNAAGLGANSLVPVIIKDNELGVQFLQSDFIVSEGIDTVQATITVVLTTTSPVPVTVDYATIPGGTATPDVDYIPVSGSLTFAPGETSKTFTLDILDDYVVEGQSLPGIDGMAETVTVELSNPSQPVILGLVRPSRVIIVDLDRPPAVLDAQFVTNERFINGVALRFSEAMTEPRMEDLKNYDLYLRKESRKFGGSPTRTRMDIVSAVYEPTSRTVTLTTAKQLRENKVYEVIVNTTRVEGVESDQGEMLDGNYDNIAGDDFTGYLSRATKISYFDQQGDRVTLALKGPGRLELFRDVERNARQVRMLFTSQDTILNGAFNPSKTTDGLAIIETLLLGTGFRNRLAQPPFKIKDQIEGLGVPNT